MLIYLVENKIIGYNTLLTHEEAQEHIIDGMSKWVDSELDIPIDIPSGKTVVMYLNDDDTIRYEFVSNQEKPDQEANRIEQIEQAIGALAKQVAKNTLLTGGNE